MTIPTEPLHLLCEAWPLHDDADWQAAVRLDTGSVDFSCIWRNPVNYASQQEAIQAAKNFCTALQACTVVSGQNA